MRSLIPIAGVCLALTACLSPTLPLPPPEEPDGVAMSSTEEGVWDIRGSSTPGAVVLIKNVSTGIIAGTEDDDGDGRYFIRVEGDLCNGAEVQELIGNDTSDTTFFLLEPRVNGEPSGECRQPQ